MIPAHECIRNDAKANEHQSAEAEGDYVANADVLFPNFSQVARRLDLDLKLGEVPEQPRVFLNRKQVPILLDLSDEVVDLGRYGPAEGGELVGGALDWQAEAADDLDRNVGYVQVEGRVGGKVGHIAIFTLTFAS